MEKQTWILIFLVFINPLFALGDLEVLPIGLPVDQSLGKLYQEKKSPLSIELKHAIKAVDEKKISLAKKLARLLQKQVLYQDYGYAIEAEAYQGEALAHLLERNYSEVIKSAQKANQNLIQIKLKNPYSPLLKTLPEALAKSDFFLGQAFYALKKFVAARDAFESAFERLFSLGGINALAKTAPDHLAAYAAICQHAQGPLCFAWLRQLFSLFPKQSREAKSMYEGIKSVIDFPKLPPLSRKGSQTYKATDLDFLAYDSAMEEYWAGKTQAAQDSLERFLELYPRSSQRFRARYWLAQALKKEGERQRAHEILTHLVKESPLSYFGLQSAFEVDVPLESFLSGIVPMALTTDPFLLPSEIIRLKRAEQLIAVGLKDLAARELRHFHIKESLSSPFLTYLAALNDLVGNHRDSFILLSELIQRGEPSVESSFVLRLIFPKPNLTAIKKVLQDLKIELDPILVLSLMKQESAFDSEAISSSGAVGLMQLMPATAFEVDPSLYRSDLASVASNIRLGSLYLYQMINRFKGNVVFAVAAYNAGPNAVDRWIREGKPKRGMTGFIDSIPYKETREYVAAILRNYYWYTHILKGENLKAFDSFWREEGSTLKPKT